MPRALLLCSLLLASATQAPSAEQGLAELETALARTPPVSTGFVEYRFSHQLRKPLRVSGQLEYRADGVMVRRVDSPYQETTEAAADQVRITRAGRPTRTVSLQRAPQLRVLLGSFRALLEGRLQPLAEDFDLTLREHGASWTLSLAPRDDKLRKYLARIEVFGHGGEPGCLEAVEPDGDGTLTLLGNATPPADPVLSRAELERACRAGMPGPPK